jgi:menaquinone-dependent protoporphyrinogen IX oxidase
MKTLILYKSKYGSTREYAQFIHRSCPGADICDLDNFDYGEIGYYDNIVLASRTYMGNIDASNFLVHHWSSLQNKNIYLLVVGMIDPEAPASKESYLKIPAHIREHIKYLKVPGRLDMQKLNWFERLVVKMQKGSSVDKVNLQLANPVIEFVHHLSV